MDWHDNRKYKLSQILNSKHNYNNMTFYYLFHCLVTHKHSRALKNIRSCLKRTKFETGISPGCLSIQFQSLLPHIVCYIWYWLMCGSVYNKEDWILFNTLGSPYLSDLTNTTQFPGWFYAWVIKFEKWHFLILFCRLRQIPN